MNLRHQDPAAVAAKRRAWRSSLALAAALAVVALGTHANTLANGFAWDDAEIVVENPATRDLGAIGEVALAPDMVKPYYRPVTRVSYLLDHAVFGMTATGFHAVNVALHLGNVLLLFALGLRLFATRLPAFAAALLLAVHPVNVESVAFVSARNNLLALFFVLAAVHLLDRAFARRSPWPLAVASGLAWFLALGSKESAATAVLFLAGWALSPLVPAHVPRRTRLLALVPHLCFAAVYLGLRRVALGEVAGEGLGLGGLVEALRVNYHVVPRYLELVLFPARLTVFHRVPDSGIAGEPWLVAAWLALAAVAFLLLRRRSLPILLGLLWLAVAYGPISNLVPIPSAAMAERYLYLPAVGVWILAGAGIGALAERLASGRAVAAGVALCAALLTARTVARNADWRDDLALFGSAVRVEPDSPVALYNLGTALREGGDLEGARRAWERAIAIDPRDAGSLAQLGTYFAVRGDLARAERLYVAALDADVEDPSVRFNLALVHDRLGRPAEALAGYEAFLEVAREEDAALVARARERRATLSGSVETARPR